MAKQGISCCYLCGGLNVGNAALVKFYMKHSRRGEAFHSRHGRSPLFRRAARAHRAMGGGLLAGWMIVTVRRSHHTRVNNSLAHTHTYRVPRPREEMSGTPATGKWG